MILAIDIGGSRIRATAWDRTLVPLGEVPTPGGDKAAFKVAIVGFAIGQSVKGISNAIAGVVAPATGLPVLVLNDADCFVLAEARQGPGRGKARGWEMRRSSA